MAIDFSDLLISTFPGINNQPTAPTSTKAENGSHLIKSYNDLVNRLETSLNNSLSNWKVISSDYTANAGDKLVVFNDGQSLTVITFPTTPIEGDAIEILLASGTVYLGNIPKYNNVGVIEIKLDLVFTPVELIYVSDTFGWVASKANVLQVTDVNNPPAS